MGFIIPKLHLLVGNVASGKTTFGRSVLATLTSEKVVYLSSDGFRSVIGKGEEDQSVSKEVFQILKWNTDYFLKNRDSVCLDATNKHPKARKDFVDIARKYGARIIMYYFYVPIEVCKERNSKRERKVPEEIIDRFQKELIVPTAEECDELYYVDEDGKIVTTFIGGGKTPVLSKNHFPLPQSTVPYSYVCYTD